jgi:hypothetical protein
MHRSLVPLSFDDPELGKLHGRENEVCNETAPMALDGQVDVLSRVQEPERLFALITAQPVAGS